MSLAGLPSLFLLPPLNCLVAACAGAALRRRVLLGAGLAGLVAFSLPVVSGTLLAALERGLPEAADPAAPPQAIVILGGNDSEVAVDGGTGFTVGWLTLERERAGAALAHRTGLPILVTGGVLPSGGPSLAVQMADSLHDDFGLTPLWRETRSVDTWENASLSAPILRAAGVDTVYVVTHAWHMRRALMAFRAAGLHPVAAPAMPSGPPHLAWRMIVPETAAWQEGYFAMHEWIGCAWYALRARLL